jgi:probable phosphoglycerate mutase
MMFGPEGQKMFLQRHGESQTNVTRLFTCRRLDPPLTETGKLQMERMVSFYRRSGVQEIITSPSLRAIQSADILGKALVLSVRADAALLEVDIGDLEGKSSRDPDCLALFLGILSDWLEHGRDTRFPGGESKAEVDIRIQRVLSLGSPSTVMIGHAALFAVLLGTNGMRYHHIEELFLPHAGTARYSTQTGRWQIVKGAETEGSGANAESGRQPRSDS